MSIWQKEPGAVTPFRLQKMLLVAAGFSLRCPGLPSGLNMVWSQNIRGAVRTLLMLRTQLLQ